MKFNIRLNEAEASELFVKGSRECEIAINGKKFTCLLEHHIISSGHEKQWWGTPTGLEIFVSGEGHDKKAQELAQAKVEVNRTKEAHKEAQRKLSALMEEDNVK